MYVIKYCFNSSTSVSKLFVAHKPAFYELRLIRKRQEIAMGTFQVLFLLFRATFIRNIVKSSSGCFLKYQCYRGDICFGIKSTHRKEHAQYNITITLFKVRQTCLCDVSLLCVYSNTSNADVTLKGTQHTAKWPYKSTIFKMN